MRNEALEVLTGDIEESRKERLKELQQERDGLEATMLDENKTLSFINLRPEDWKPEWVDMGTAYNCCSVAKRRCERRLAEIHWEVMDLLR